MLHRPVLVLTVALVVALVPRVSRADDEYERVTRRFQAACAVFVAAAGIAGAWWILSRPAPPPVVKEPRGPSVGEVRRATAAAQQAAAEATAKETVTVGKRMSDADYKKLRGETLKSSDSLEAYVGNLSKALGAAPALQDAWIAELRLICDKEWIDPAKLRIRDVPGLDEGRFVDPIVRAVMMRHMEKTMAAAARTGARSEAVDTAKLALLLPFSVLGGSDGVDLCTQATVDSTSGTVDKALLAKRLSLFAGLEETKARAALKTMRNFGLLAPKKEEKP